MDIVCDACMYVIDMDIVCDACMYVIDMDMFGFDDIHIYHIHTCITYIHIHIYHIHTCIWIVHINRAPFRLYVNIHISNFIYNHTSDIVHMNRVCTYTQTYKRSCMCTRTKKPSVRTRTKKPFCAHESRMFAYTTVAR